MAPSPPPHARPALCTVGKAARGLLGLWDGRAPAVLAGTALAHGPNRVHALSFDPSAHAVAPRALVAAPAEVWALRHLARPGDAVHVLVAARRAARPSVDVWRLPALSAEAPPQARVAHPARVVEVASCALHAPVLDAAASEKRPHACLAVTQTGATLLDVADSVRCAAALKVDDPRFTLAAAAFEVVAGDWMDASSVFVASSKCLGVFDVRSGELAASLVVGKILEVHHRSSSALCVPSHPSRVSSACSDGEHVLYTGSQDGCIRAFDTRTRAMLWQVQHAPFQHASALRCASKACLISGGTDGVVRCWSGAGKPLTTFPHHDDTVTNISAGSHAFATVSYDGRVAINRLPVAA